MLGTFKPSLFVVFAVIPGLVSGLAAQVAGRPTPLVRVAAQLTALTQNRNPKVFISNVGSDNDPGGPDRAYNKFYATLQRSGQYQLVGSPAEADFVFEIRYTDPLQNDLQWVDKEKPFKKDATKPAEREIAPVTVYHPQLRLVVLDPDTLAVRGAFTEFIQDSYTRAVPDSIFSDAIKALVNDVGTLMGASPVRIEVPKATSDPPVPSQIKNAKTVFISNAIPSNQAYNKFYAMMKSWGGYQLSPTPADADLIFEVYSRYHLAILDPRTGVTLWGFTPDVKLALLRSTADKHFDQTLATIVQEVARMAGRPVAAVPVPQSVKDAPLPPQLSSAKTVFIANVGGEPLNDWKGRPLQPYNVFYATVKGWARFELVPTPADADLVFQVSVALSEPLLLRLTILDSRTQAVLWRLEQDIHSDQTLRGSFADKKDLDKAMAALVTSLAKLTGQPDAQISVPPDTQSAPLSSISNNFTKVFISRPREQGAFFEDYAPDQLYETLEADIRNWGRYQLTTPGDSDLIFEPSSSGNRVRLTIRDAKTRHVLWTFVRPVKIAFFNDSAIENYKAAIGLLVDDLRTMTSANVPPPHVNAAKH